MVLYFSGTGNSRYVAERIAVTLGDELFEQPGRIDLMLKLTFSGCISLRTNTVSVYVTE